MNTSIRDNFSCGSVGDFLDQQIERDSELSIVSAYFNFFAYEKVSNGVSFKKEDRR